jgi:hypothetical protein
LARPRRSHARRSSGLHSSGCVSTAQTRHGSSKRSPTPWVALPTARSSSLRSKASGSHSRRGSGSRRSGRRARGTAVGPFRIQNAPATSTSRCCGRDLTTSPVGRDRTHDKAVEFTYSGGVTHWFALPVSAEGVLVRHKLEDRLAHLLRVSPSLVVRHRRRPAPCSHALGRCGDGPSASPSVGSRPPRRCLRA